MNKIKDFSLEYDGVYKITYKDNIYFFHISIKQLIEMLKKEGLDINKIDLENPIKFKKITLTIKSIRLCFTTNEEGIELLTFDIEE